MSAFESAPRADNALHIPKIVITGGPCSGKTTGMALLQAALKGLGYRVFIAPEAATMFFLAGVQFSDLSNPQLSTAFQKTVLNGQLHLEDSLDRYARSTGQKAIILCDRGAMDGKAYMDDDAFNEVLVDGGLNPSSANAGRYDAVFHLVTAADGAPQHYSLDNNETRTESVDYAIVIDKKTQLAYAGHPKHFIIDNSGASFDDKMDRLIATMLQSIGHAGGSDRSVETAARSACVYHFELTDISHADVLAVNGVQVFNVEKIAMALEGCPYHLVAAVSASGATDVQRVELHRQFPRVDGVPEVDARHQSAYSLVHVHTAAGSRPAETRRILGRREYEFLKELFSEPLDQSTRYCFIWENQVMHLHEGSRWELTVYGASREPALPAFLASAVGGGRAGPGDHTRSS